MFHRALNREYATSEHRGQAARIHTEDNAIAAAVMRPSMLDDAGVAKSLLTCRASRMVPKKTKVYG